MNRLFFMIILFSSCVHKKSNLTELKELSKEDFLSNYFQMNPCEKIEYARKAVYLSNVVHNKIANDMFKLTGISSSMTAGTIGIYYDSIPLFFSDLKKWGKALNCN